MAGARLVEDAERAEDSSLRERSTPRAPRVLVADDNPVSLELVVRALRESGFDVLSAIDGVAALQLAREQSPDAVLLDMHMPVRDGIEVCELLKAEPATADIPVVFVSGLGTDFNRRQAFGAGAVDYVVKPLHAEELKRRLGAHLDVARLKRELVVERSRGLALRSENQVLLARIAELETSAAKTAR